MEEEWEVFQRSIQKETDVRLLEITRLCCIVLHCVLQLEVTYPNMLGPEGVQIIEMFG